MKILEIERKFKVKSIPLNLNSYSFHIIEQAYLNIDPVIRVRKQDNSYFLTYKGKGKMTREECNLPLNAESYAHMLQKADGNIITKKRYLIPLEACSLTIELDIFDPPFEPLVIAEVEFSSAQEAESFIPPNWFAEEVTYSDEYHNSYLSRIPL